MTKHVWLCVVVVAASGCVLNRSLVITEPNPTIDVSDVRSGWDLVEVFSTASGRGSRDQRRNFDPLRQQLEQRLTDTLQQQAALSAKSPGHDYLVSLEVKVAEEDAVSPWILATIGIDSGIIGAGMVIGSMAGGPVGMLVGIAASAPVALIGASIPPSGDDTGSFEGTLTLRRRGGPVLSTRHVHSSWKVSASNLGRSDRLAEVSGACVPEFERELLKELHAMLVEVDGTVSPSVPPLPN